VYFQLERSLALIRMTPDAHPFGLPVHLAPLPAGSIQSGRSAPSR